MGKAKNPAVRVDRELVGEPYEIDGLSLTPVVRVKGVLSLGPQPAGGHYEAGFLQLRPTRIEVRRAGGMSGSDADEAIHLATPDLQEQIARNMSIAAGLVALTAVIVMLVRRLRN